MRPLNLVNVLEQLPEDVVGMMVLGQLAGDDIRSFKLVAPSTLALVRRTSRVLRLRCFPRQSELQSEVDILSKYEACTEVQLVVGMYSDVAPEIVGTSSTSTAEKRDKAHAIPLPPRSWVDMHAAIVP